MCGQHAAARFRPDGPALIVRHRGERADDPVAVVRDEDGFSVGEQDIKPLHLSLMIGVPQAAASNSLTLGDQPAAIMSARVTFRVKRWRL